MAKEDFCRETVHPIEIGSTRKLPELLDAMSRISFQGRNFGKAYQIWSRMLREEKCLIFLGLAGAMIPAGLRVLLVELMELRLVDCIVSTGANLFHDVYETLGFDHFPCDPNVDDNMLRKIGLDRIYDTVGLDREMIDTDEYIGKFAGTIDKPMISTREFTQRMGEYLQKDKKRPGLVEAASRLKVPIYCPAIGDSSIGIAIACYRRKYGIRTTLEAIQDVVETADLMTDNTVSGAIFVGGGTPRNFIQQSGVTANLMTIIAGQPVDYCHKYGIRITADAPHWGGLSGSTFSEAQSWGKYHPDAEFVSVYCDATIALPILANGLVEKFQGETKNRAMPRFRFWDSES